MNFVDQIASASRRPSRPEDRQAPHWAARPACRAHRAPSRSGQRLALRHEGGPVRLRPCPEANIALRPARPRDSARMLLVDGDRLDRPRRPRPSRAAASPGDVLVFNDTKVIPAQLEGRRGEAKDRRDACTSATTCAPGGPSSATPSGCGRRHASPSAAEVEAVCEEKGDDGAYPAALSRRGAGRTAAHRAGTMPLPPYIASKRPIDEGRRRRLPDHVRGAGRARLPRRPPRFTSRRGWSPLDAAGIARETLTLHVGAGTFLPVKADDTADHRMHAEWGRIDAATADRLNAARAAGGRIIAVGTTVLRLLESAAGEDGGSARSKATPPSSSRPATAGRRSTG
jgi:S-adenosylmethionine:tRNA ribosyltransferase-isomerase